MTDHQPTRVLYIASVLPKRSETFVYREVLGLQSRNTSVLTASVRDPENHLGDPCLDKMANDATVVYSRGLILNAILGACAHPLTAVRGIVDALFASDIRLNKRPHALVQTLGGLSLARRLRHENITHIHAHMAHVPTTIAMVAATALRVPFSFTGHAADLFRDRQMLPTKLKRAAFIACISDWHRGFYRQWVNLSDDRLPIVRCGVDLDEFVPGTGSEQGKNLLAVGRLVPKKGFDTLIRAMAVLLQDNDTDFAPLRLNLLGDGPEMSNLQKLAAELDLTDRITFAGAADQQQVRAAMRQADVFVLPCRISTDGDRDGIPVVLMEAMASAVPVVSGDLPTIRELVTDNQTGLMVEPDQPDVLAIAIRRLLSDPALSRSIGQAARGRVAQEFASDINLDRLERSFNAARRSHERPVEPGLAIGTNES